MFLQELRLSWYHQESVMIRAASWAYYAPFLITAAIMIILPLTPSGDVYHLVEVSRTVLSGGLIYRDVEFTYPPVYAYLDALAMLVLGDNQYAWKIAPVIFHLCTAVLLRKGVQEKTALYLYLFCPLPLLVSSYWGQFDVVAGFFSVLALIFLLKGRSSLSGLSLALGISTKYFPVILLIPFLLYLNEGRFRYLVTVISASLLVNMPFMILAGHLWFQQTFLFHMSRDTGGYSLYNLLAWKPFGGPSEIGLLLPISLLFLTFVTLSRRKNLVANSAMFMIVTVLFNKVVFWYAQWFLPFVILSYYEVKRDKILLVAVLLTQIFVYVGPYAYLNTLFGQHAIDVVIALGWFYLLAETTVLARLFEFGHSYRQ